MSGVRDFLAAFFVAYGGIVVTMFVAGIVMGGSSVLSIPVRILLGAPALAFGAGAGRVGGVTPARVAGAVLSLLVPVALVYSLGAL